MPATVFSAGRDMRMNKTQAWFLGELQPVKETLPARNTPTNLPRCVSK